MTWLSEKTAARTVPNGVLTTVAVAVAETCWGGQAGPAPGMRASRCRPPRAARRAPRAREPDRWASFSGSSRRVFVPSRRGGASARIRRVKKSAATHRRLSTLSTQAQTGLECPRQRIIKCAPSLTWGCTAKILTPAGSAQGRHVNRAGGYSGI